MAFASSILALLLRMSYALVQGPSTVGIDPKTGRAISAQEISPEALKSKIDEEPKTLVVDVRDPQEFAHETINGAMNIPVAEFERWLQDIPKDTILVFT